MENKNSETIKKNAFFQNFEAFDKVLMKWMTEENQRFRISSSATKRLDNGTPDDIFKYNVAVYQCIHFGKPRCRSKFFLYKFFFLNGF